MSSKLIEVKLTTTVPDQLFKAKKDKNYWQCVKDTSFTSPYSKSSNGLAKANVDADFFGGCSTSTSKFGVYFYIPDPDDAEKDIKIGWAHYYEKSGSGNKWTAGSSGFFGDYEQIYQMENSAGSNTTTKANWTIKIFKHL